MYNIYKLLQESVNNPSLFTADVHSFIIDSLTNSFNKALSRNDTVNDLSFSFVDSVAGTSFSLNYTFKYGRLHITHSGETVYVYFSLYDSASKKLNIAFELNYFVVYVDHSMNYTYADFTRDFQLRSNMKAYADLRVSHIVFENHKSDKLVTDLLYGNIPREIFSSKSNRFELAERYFTMDSKFLYYFSKLLILCDINSRTFKDAFPEYDSIISSITHHIDIVMLLNIFEKEYSENFEVIESKMTIANMISI